MPQTTRRRVIRVFLLALAIVVAVVLLRTAMLTPEPFDPGAAPAVPAVEVTAAAERLARAVRIPSISPGGTSKGDPEQLRALHRQLETDFPRVHQALQREVVNELSLLYRWPGTDPQAEPILLLAHLDVVPVEPGTESAWTHPPFSGDIVDGVIWGRGTMDDKIAVVGLLQAIELLLAEGFSPRATVVLAFGHDEEIGGIQGAKAIATRLAERGERFAFALDEGGVIISETIPGLEPAAALIGVAEKGFASIELTLAAEGGHASMPPARSAIGRLGEALARLEQEPMPAEVRGATRQMFETLAPHMSFGPRIPMANLWLLDGLLTRILSTQPPTNATVRTTMALTMFDAGTSHNVLASQASAVVNARILPGDSVQSVLEHVREVIDDPEIEARCLEDLCWEPTRVSRTDSEGYDLVRRSIAHVFPDAVIAPYLMVAAADAHHYDGVARDVYRFLPIAMVGDDRKRIHGTDEQLTLEGLADAVRFYMTLITLAAG